MSVLTCEESLDKLKPMADSLMDRYKRAEETTLEQLFDDWAESGMIVRLDILH